MLSTYWERLTQLGTDPTYSAAENRRIALANQLTFTLLLVPLLYLIRFEGYPKVQAVMVVCFSAFGFSFLFMLWGLTLLARLHTVVVITGGLLAVESVTHGPGTPLWEMTPAHILLVATFSLGPIFFGLSNWRWLVACSLVIVAGFVGLPYVVNHTPNWAEGYTPSYANRLYVASTIAALGLSFALQYLVRLNNLLFWQVRQELEVARQKHRAAEETLAELRATQDQLLQSEKLAQLGQTLASVAHELNTPVATLIASAHTLREVVPHALRVLPLQVASLPAELQPYFFELIDIALRYEPTLSTREARRQKQRIAEWAITEHFDDPDGLANTLQKLGIVDNLPQYLPALHHPKSADLLRLVGMGARARQSLDFLAHAGTQTQRLIQGLKAYARSSPEEPVAIEVGPHIQQVVALFTDQLGEVELTTHYAEAMPPVYAQPEELTQVWTNLIANALQAMGGKGTLSIQAQPLDHWVQVEVTDSGPGIPPEVQPKIFSAFFTTKAPGEGTGLGLAIVRRIVERHRGMIQLDSEPGRTVFTVLLPVARG